jgi:hypothetical protein
MPIMKISVILLAVIVLSLGSADAKHHNRARDRAQRRCMVYLPDMPDAQLRHWCLKQSEKMP